MNDNILFIWGLVLWSLGTMYVSFLIGYWAAKMEVKIEKK